MTRLSSGGVISMVDVGDSVDNVVTASRKRGLTSSWLVGGTWRQILKSFMFPTISVVGEARDPSNLPPIPLVSVTNPSTFPLFDRLFPLGEACRALPPPFPRFPPPITIRDASRTPPRSSLSPPSPVFLHLATHAHDVKNTLSIDSRRPSCRVFFF